MMAFTSQHSPTLRARVILVVCAVTLWSAPAFVQVPERLSDVDIKALLAQVDDDRDKFEGNLDGGFKGSTIRTTTGETKVSGALQDYQDNVKKLKDRFTPDYAASAEVATVLKQGTAIDKFMQSQAVTMKGRSEWDRQAMSLKRLAAAYGTTFPLPDGASVRRMNDKETAGAAAAIATAADRFKSDIDKNKTLAKPVKDAAKKDVELLGDLANTVKSRLNDGKPATSELKQLIDQLGKVQTFVGANAMPSMANWQTLQGSFTKLQQGFGLAK